MRISTRLVSTTCKRAAALVMVCLLCSAGSASAQLIEQYFPTDIPGYAPDLSASVVDRMYVQEQSPGVEIGGYVIRPQISENTGYNSNTLAAPNSGSSELESMAGVRVNSDWTRDALGVSFNVDDHRYFEEPVASYTNWTASIGGSIDLGNDVANFAYSRLSLNLAATDIGVAGVTTPVPYSVDDARFSYVRLFGRFSMTPAFEFENFSFGISSGANNFSYASLDHQTYIETLATRYEFTPGDAAVVILRSSQAEFHNDTGHNYADFASFFGLDSRAASVIQYRVLVGVEGRSFQNSPVSAVVMPTFELNIVWTPTELDTITITGIHRLDDPTSPFSQDQNILDGRLQLDHELRRNIFLNGYIEASRSISRSSIPDGGSDTQRQVNLGAGATWLINSHLSATVSYSFIDSSARSNSSIVTATESGYPSFVSHTILAGLKLDL